MIKLLKFLIVGGINTLISLLVFYILNKILAVNYFISSACGYICGMFNSYILNKKWTFEDSDNNILSQFIKFAAINGISLLINLFAMYILIDKLYIDSFIAQIFATVFSTASNYIGSRVLVFKKLKIES
ncbi:GtrA family protein [Clostridium sp. SYSU_GA19001]|uniref:GtrA family protein n=1 Tax=Clostridium caldaquaticum TaxID=2940653 RepID=UPI002076F627|nr:GtrA family protein [Clostridium caldaquaticum]MCM8709617.1 GtrA family protein [Clostridium caldaquaticum]